LAKIKRKLYKRGSSFETTIPMPLLFDLDSSKKHLVVFNYEKGRWYLTFENQKTKEKRKRKRGRINEI